MRVASLLSLVALFTASASDWPEFMGPARDQTSPETGLLNAWPESGPPRLWEKEIGTGYGAPSVRAGMLVLHHRVGGEEIVEALDAATGVARWRYAYASSFTDPFGYNNGPRCTPLLTADHCYTFGAEGVLLCLDRTTGKLIWRRDTQKDFEVPEAFFGVGSTPILEDGRLIVMVGAQPNAAIVAFDAETGATAWQNVGEKTWNGVAMTGWPGERKVEWNRANPIYEKQASYSTPVGAAIHGQRHVLCLTAQGLVSLAPKTGEVQFSYWFRVPQNESVNAMTPVVSGDLIFVSSAYYRLGSVVLRVRPDGRGVDEVWRSRVIEVHWTRPVLHEGHLYAFSGRNEPDAKFACVELATGKLKWERDEGWRRGAEEPQVFGRGSAILADGKLIGLGETGMLGLFRPSAERLEELSRFRAPGLEYPCWAAPVLADGRLYLRSEKRLVCLNLAPP
ncbi:MAG TPA: PQQ-binding-like beta-propeller repeat protein [Chthoniobacteraceae bacterium]|jgi:outer membrane protein assembly factor BamB